MRVHTFIWRTFLFSKLASRCGAVRNWTIFVGRFRVLDDLGGALILNMMI